MQWIHVWVALAFAGFFFCVEQGCDLTVHSFIPYKESNHECITRMLDTGVSGHSVS